MRIITCASYFGTGSSAITDFVSEFDSVNSMGKYEFRFIQDPDGISDLEYNIVENNHRHNTSNAIKRFMKFTNNFRSFGYGGGYKNIFSQFQQYTQEYIEDITELKTKSWWHRDRIDKGNMFCIIDRAYSLIRRLLNGGIKTERKYSLLKFTEWGYFTAISEDEFLRATRNYIDKVIGISNKSNKPNIMVDQLLPPTNLERYLRYFNDVKVIVVERDPRDVYLYEKTRYQWGVVPTDSVEDYVEWFKITRKYSRPISEDQSRILRIQFEDLIYRYDKTTELITNFLGLTRSEHKYKLQKFDPKISIKNTDLKNKISGFSDEIEYIEKNLSDYIYNFPENRCKGDKNESINS